MKSKVIESRFEAIFTKEELERISIREECGIEVVVADLHQMSRAAAKRFIKNIIAAVRLAFELLIVHGYHHGTALRDMFRVDFSNSRIKAVVPDFENDGRTILMVGVAQ